MFAILGLKFLWIPLIRTMQSFRICFKYCVRDLLFNLIDGSYFRDNRRNMLDSFN